MLTTALAQIDIVPGRPDINTQTIMDAITQAQQSNADIVVFPEMAVPGYFLGDLWEQPAFLRDCEYFGEQIIQTSKDIVVVFGNVAIDWNRKGNDGRPLKYNAAFVAQNGVLLGDDDFPHPFRVKTLQPNYREFDDDRHFYSALKLAQELGTPIEKLLTPVQANIDGKAVSLGCILCEDGWDDDYSVKPTQILADNGADIIVNLSSSPFTLGKNPKRNRVFSAQAKTLGLPVIYVNNTGVQNIGKTVYGFDGYSTAYSACGDIITQCEPFTPSVTTVDVFSKTSQQSNPAPLTNITDPTEAAELFQALSYSTQKMLASINVGKVVVGASGGIDSAVVAALLCHVVSPENVLLVNMPSQYNSATTKNLARALASNLGCLYAVAPIQASVELTLGQLADCPVTDLSSGKTVPMTVAPIVAENIQARDRSSRVLAAFAAAWGAVFSCNANKSETTVGYSTLYGDQSGFLAPIADLWKYQVYDLGRYLNDAVFQREVIPEGIFDVVPSAELSDQHDVDKGMGDPLHYPYHDYLFKSWMEWWQPASPEEILLWYSEGILDDKLGCKAGVINARFDSVEAFIDDLEHWWRLFKGMGIAKRIQAPPVIAVSRRAYGFDYREAQNTVYFSRRYLALKQRLVEKK